MQVQVTDNTDIVAKTLEGIAGEYLTDGARLLLSQVQSNTRVDTGQTKGSWRSVVEKDRAVVGSDDPNAIWEEFGTGHYALDGNGRQDPWYIPVDGYLGHKKPTFEGKVTIVYGRGGKAYYKTDGKRPNRALYNAKQTTAPQLEKHFWDLFHQQMGKYTK